MEVIHAAVSVASLDRSLEFYVDGLGLTDRWGFERDGVTHRYLGGSEGAEIQLVEDSDAAESNSRGVDHVAVEVADLDATFETLTEQTSCPVDQPPSTLTVTEVETRYAFVEDPDGNRVELVERTSDHPGND
ncbi:Glyoxalase/bleomycin resistance protein/dioxygenase (plasmid) [halophilic archaeon DL31]|nr:Glyoxalase/bleomycin resistance protein/dioxygenase [halophilic archaeon DL31]